MKETIFLSPRKKRVIKNVWQDHTFLPLEVLPHLSLPFNTSHLERTYFQSLLSFLAFCITAWLVPPALCWSSSDTWHWRAFLPSYSGRSGLTSSWTLQGMWATAPLRWKMILWPPLSHTCSEQSWLNSQISHGPSAEPRSGLPPVCGTSLFQC